MSVLDNAFSAPTGISGPDFSESLFDANEKGKAKNFKVVVRVRPHIEREAGVSPCVNVTSTQSAVIQRPANAGAGHKEHTFVYDRIYDDQASQQSLYDSAVRPVVLSVLEGYNGSIIAYGQTGTGKTYTVEGGEGDFRGIIPRASEEIFHFIEDKTHSNSKFLVRASFLQIYNEKIADLLDPDAVKRTASKSYLKLREDGNGGVYVNELSEHIVRSPAEVAVLLKLGSQMRTTAATNMNRESSRSHAVFSVIVEKSEVDEQTGESNVTIGRLNLVDLAGSERIKKTGVESGKKLDEMKNINTSLTAFGKVVLALTSPGNQFVPYRDSKLTRILQGSLGGNCKTTMITTVTSAANSYQETLNSFKFAKRAKKVKNFAVVNQDLSERALLSMYEKEIKKLRAALEAAKTAQHGGSNAANDDQRGDGPDTAFDVASGKMVQVSSDRTHVEGLLMQHAEEAERASMEKELLVEKIASLEEQLLLGGHEIEESEEFIQAIQKVEQRLEAEYNDKFREIEEEKRRLREEKEQLEREKTELERQRTELYRQTTNLSRLGLVDIARAIEAEGEDPPPNMQPSRQASYEGSQAHHPWAEVPSTASSHVLSPRPPQSPRHVPSQSRAHAYHPSDDAADSQERAESPPPLRLHVRRHGSKHRVIYTPPTTSHKMGLFDDDNDDDDNEDNARTDVAGVGSSESRRRRKGNAAMIEGRVDEEEAEGEAEAGDVFQGRHVEDALDSSDDEDAVDGALPEGDGAKKYVKRAWKEESGSAARVDSASKSSATSSATSTRARLPFMPSKARTQQEQQRRHMQPARTASPKSVSPTSASTAQGPLPVKEGSITKGPSLLQTLRRTRSNAKPKKGQQARTSPVNGSHAPLGSSDGSGSHDTNGDESGRDSSPSTPTGSPYVGKRLNRPQQQRLTASTRAHAAPRSAPNTRPARLASNTSAREHTSTSLQIPSSPRSVGRRHSQPGRHPSMSDMSTDYHARAGNEGEAEEADATLQDYIVALRHSTSGVPTQSIQHEHRILRNVFTGLALCKWFMENVEAIGTLEEAAALGQPFMDVSVIASLQGHDTILPTQEALYHFVEIDSSQGGPVNRTFLSENASQAAVATSASHLHLSQQESLQSVPQPRGSRTSQMRRSFSRLLFGGGSHRKGDRLQETATSNAAMMRSSHSASAFLGSTREVSESIADSQYGSSSNTTTHATPDAATPHGRPDALAVLDVGSTMTSSATSSTGHAEDGREPTARSVPPEQHRGDTSSAVLKQRRDTEMLALQMKQELGLVSANPSSSGPVDQGQTLLHTAAGQGDRHAIKEFLRTMDVNALDNMGRPPLMYASIGNKPKAVELLISSGADLRTTDKNGHSALVWAAYFDHHAVIQVLLKHDKGLLKVLDPTLRSALHWAAKHRTTRSLDAILKVCDASDINAQDHEKVTPLHWAVLCQNEAHARSLLLAGADPSITDNQGRTPLHYAASNDTSSCLELFLEKTEGIVNMRDIRGRTALHLAIGEQRSLEMVMTLLNCPETDVNATDVGTRTPLHWAAVCDRKEVCELLARRGAKLQYRDKIGMTALHWAIEKGYSECAATLQSLANQQTSARMARTQRPRQARPIADTPPAKVTRAQAFFSKG